MDVNESLRTYFASRQAWKAFLRQEKEGLQELAPGYDYARDGYFVRPLPQAGGRRVLWRGIALLIEIEAGADFPRHQEGRRTPSPNAYGSVADSMDTDLDGLDFFLGPDLASDTVALIDQLKPDGRFDEHKVLLAFTLATEEDARRCYLENYEADWTGYGGARLCSVAEFKDWLVHYDPSRPATGVPVEPPQGPIAQESDHGTARYAEETEETGPEVSQYTEGKALAEASGASGGYTAGIDWDNVRCPSCGSHLWCECSGRKEVKAFAGNSFPEGSTPQTSDWRADSLDPGEVLSGPT